MDERHPSDEALPAAPPSREYPSSGEAEEHVIAVCWLDDTGGLIARCVSSGVNTKSFFSPANQLLWEITIHIWSSKPPVTLEVVAEELRTQRKLEAVGGFAYLMQVTGRIPTTAHAGYFIEKLLEKERLRAMIRTFTGAVEQCYAFSGGLGEFVSKVASEVNVALGITGEAEERIQVVAGKLAAEVETWGTAAAPPKPRTVAWGLVDIDRMCGEMSPGELVILAGRPSTGKSSLADQVMWKSAKLGDDPAVGGSTLMFTYEMTKREKAVRIAQQVTNYNWSQLDALMPNQRQEFAAAFRAIHTCKHLHVFERDTSVVRIAARVRTFLTRGPVRLIVVDFLQYLARLEPLVGRERTDEKIGRLTAAFKDLAKECGCPVLMLSSLNREGEKEGRPPRMSDLRASGEIESDADVIALLHWPKENPLSQQAQDPHDHLERFFYVDFNQEKGRNKGVHQAGLMFDRVATKFNNATA